MYQVRSSKLSEEGVTDRPLGTDRLTSLPTELQLKIVKHLIPNRGRIAIGYDLYGPNTSGIQPGSLSISRVSKHLSKIALQVLYGCRWFRISGSCLYDCDFTNFVHTVSVSKICVAYQLTRIGYRQPEHSLEDSRQQRRSGSSTSVAFGVF